jgi:hypothetical protein
MHNHFLLLPLSGGCFIRSFVGGDVCTRSERKEMNTHKEMLNLQALMKL